MKPLSFYILFILMHFSLGAQADYVRRINCGSSSSAIYEDQVFDADVHLTGEVEYDSDKTFSAEGLSLPQPFKSVRYTKSATMYYRFYLENGSYKVILYFAEPYHGLAQANKAMHLSAIAYNLKKYLKFTKKRSKSWAGSLALITFMKNTFHDLSLALARYPKTTLQY